MIRSHRRSQVLKLDTDYHPKDIWEIQVITLPKMIMMRKCPNICRLFQIVANGFGGMTIEEEVTNESLFMSGTWQSRANLNTNSRSHHSFVN